MSYNTWTCTKCGAVHPMDHAGIFKFDGPEIVEAYCSGCSPLPQSVIDLAKG